MKLVRDGRGSLSAVRKLSETLDMGGEREVVVKTSSPITVATDDITPQEIRIHENKGQVHFHSKSLKVVVPVPVWAKVWERLSNPATDDAEEFTYTDLTNKSLLFVRTGNYPNNDGSGFTLEAEVRIHPLTETNTVYDMLHKFANPS